MANGGVLSGIMNPAIADVSGSFQAGRQTGINQETQRIAGELLGQTFGGQLGQLGKLNPDSALKIAEATGIPVGSEAATKKWIGDTQVASTILNSVGPREASQYLSEQAVLLESAGQTDMSQRYMRAVQGLNSGDPAQIAAVGDAMSSLVQGFQEQGILKAPKTETDGTGKASAVTRILADGTTIQALPNASVQVTDPSGNIVTGADRLEVLKNARIAEQEQARALAGQKETGKIAAQISKDAFERLEPINTAVANINEGIRLLDEGASTGPIMSKLPSIRSASVQLDNLQGRLGLDVIGQTTFGALSESELRFALDTALPKNLEPAELRDWLIEKRDAQQKLANYLGDVAVFLGTPGNTVADWVSAQRELRASQPAPEQEAAGTATAQPSVDLSTLSDEELLQLRQQAGGQ
jgi:hypothetical protein